MRFLLVALVVILGQEPVSAQTESPADAPKGQVVAVGNDGAHAIGLLLRCPVCQGMPISDSPADMAQSMMAKVRTMHSEGKSQDEILKYFTDRYGDWVLLKPKASGFNWVVWILPPVALLLGLLAAIFRGKSSEKKQAESLETSPESTGDEYLQAIRNEVEY